MAERLFRKQQIPVRFQVRALNGENLTKIRSEPERAVVEEEHTLFLRGVCLRTPPKNRCFTGRAGFNLLTSVDFFQLCACIGFPGCMQENAVGVYPAFY